ncbi:hypothetical protein A5906_20225 [Bradyrhizobium sacchari]|uniref:Uncharacterized protein n=1 Tax=Bradyrhizobium sacchari TaxID=1399419 RepID=A0A560KD65_9BRAD|nr:hypothetical protein [Bradyrhizobium sacchari]OPZ00505.1 hypothetical protein A5906_20225 [Bradyrhizobium sacchari]TWB64952.1 hypothetical protein FBZ94_102496 [Bradyrhizobium sacchari]TWB81275.1 hypothetical protein FBZ95_102496 [Bradyrhizobium sacchari]
MRKLILIAAISLLATEAYAGGPRSLSLAASNASQQVMEQPATAAAAPQTNQAPSAQLPTNVRTATTGPTSTPTTAPATAPAATTPAQPAARPAATTTETAKPKRRQPSTEARVIRELHRHGIYW